MGREHPAFRWGLFKIDPNDVRNHGLGIGTNRSLRSLVKLTLLFPVLIATLFVWMALK